MTGHHGLFIAFEGGDGAGKSTQVRLLADALRLLGRTVSVTRQPGGTDLGQSIRDLVLHGDHVSPRAEALLFAADKAHHVDVLVRPALDRGEVVVTDRYTDSSVAYQGAGRDLGAVEVHDLQMWAVDGLTPDLTVVVDISAQEGRRRRGDVHDRLESEGDPAPAGRSPHAPSLPRCCAPTGGAGSAGSAARPWMRRTPTSTSSPPRVSRSRWSRRATSWAWQPTDPRSGATG